MKSSSTQLMKSESESHNNQFKEGCFPIEIQHSIETKSELYQQLKEDCFKEDQDLDIRHVSIRKMEKQDLKVIQDFHEEWFPLKYDQPFF